MCLGHMERPDTAPSLQMASEGGVVEGPAHWSCVMLRWGCRDRPHPLGHWGTLSASSRSRSWKIKEDQKRHSRGGSRASSAVPVQCHRQTKRKRTLVLTASIVDSSKRQQLDLVGFRAPGTSQRRPRSPPPLPDAVPGPAFHEQIALAKTLSRRIAAMVTNYGEEGRLYDVASIKTGQSIICRLERPGTS